MNAHIAITIEALRRMQEQDEQTIDLTPDDYLWLDTRPCAPVTLSEPVGRV